MQIPTYPTSLLLRVLVLDKLDFEGKTICAETSIDILLETDTETLDPNASMKEIALIENNEKVPEDIKEGLKEIKKLCEKNPSFETALKFIVEQVYLGGKQCGEEAEKSKILEQLHKITTW